jgi:diaminopimelate decarboxylase
MLLVGGSRADERHGRLRGRDVYSVVTVKRGPRTFVAVDGRMGDNLEVALHGQRFEPRSPTGWTRRTGETVTVVAAAL